MSRRRTYEIPGIDHGSAPIPMAARVGPVLRSSGIMGRDPATNQLPDDPARQVDFVFANALALLDVAEVELDQVVHVEVLLADNRYRDAVNERWVSLFPDLSDRPARHTTVRELPGGMVVQLCVEAVIEER
jgi:2-iminobutanoate/2-iminopropanoate deaminase